VQVLAQIGRQVVGVYDSVNDLGGLKSPYWQFATGGAAPTYPIAEVYQGPIFSKYNPGARDDLCVPGSAGRRRRTAASSRSDAARHRRQQ